MSSRAETDVINFRVKLEKSLTNDDTPLEELIDVLNALKKVPISIDLLRKTKIGQTLQEIKKKNAANNVGTVTKLLLSKWKKDCEPVTAAASSIESKVKSESPVQNETKTETASPAAKGWGTIVAKPSTSTTQTNKEEEEMMDEGMYDLLSAQRKQVMNLFVSSFKLQINEQIAKFLSFNIEASIYQLHNAERDNKAYMSKAKTLAFNLKKNEVCMSISIRMRPVL